MHYLSVVLHGHVSISISFGTVSQISSKDEDGSCVRQGKRDKASPVTYKAFLLMASASPIKVQDHSHQLLCFEEGDMRWTELRRSDTRGCC